MTTSGTTNFSVDVITALEEAFERAGRTFRSGYDYESAVRSMNLMFTEWANLGINLWTLDQINVTTVVGDGNYNLPADTVDAISLVINNDGNDYRISRIGFNEYAGQVNKTKQARPTQYWIERLTAQPVLNLHPVPDKVYTIKIWRLRRIQDAGSAANTLDIPFRFYEALIAGVALRIGKKNTQLDPQRLDVLKTDYREAMLLAQGEDRDRSSFYIRPTVRR